MSEAEPIYRKTHRCALLKAKAERAMSALKHCDLCPRRCGIDRLAGETGYCRTGAQAMVSSFDAHFGEEAPLVGRRGSGTIFFTHCNLGCNFCQNYEISHLGVGRETSHRELAEIMLRLQDEGCHNINFVTPSHVVAQILCALVIAVEEGLRVPLVYNSGGYDRVTTLQLLEGVVDIYMPDFKFWDSAIAERTCEADNYPHYARRSLKEMHRQVGDLVIDQDGLARRGILLRHLVLPDDSAGTEEVMRFVAGEISTDTYVNIMAQYRPCGRAAEVPAMSRAITTEEYRRAVDAARRHGITRLDRPRRIFMWE
jgi:putative pyruvate formate lyase activating enzyme